MTVKTDLSIHLIFVTKYRKPCLTEEIMSYCVDILKQECYNINIEVIAIQGDNQDHIHMILKLKPLHSVSHVVQILKQKSRYQVWQKYPGLRKFYWYKDLLWSNGYFCTSIENASKETIEKYINKQGN